MHSHAQTAKTSSQNYGSYLKRKRVGDQGTKEKSIGKRSGGGTMTASSKRLLFKKDNLKALLTAYEEPHLIRSLWS